MLSLLLLGLEFEVGLWGAIVGVLSGLGPLVCAVFTAEVATKFGIAIVAGVLDLFEIAIVSVACLFSLVSLACRVSLSLIFFELELELELELEMELDVAMFIQKSPSLS
jgi:hypothetical protein